MHSRLILFAGCLCALLAAPAAAFAQSQDPQTSGAQVRFHVGPLGLSPTLTLGNLGIDTNVFNTTTDPTRDFTVTLTPATGEALPVGRLLLTGVTGVPLTYFQKSTTQRSVGLQQSGRVELNLIHLVPYSSVSYNSIDSRPDAEIDARVQSVTAMLVAGAILRLGPRTTLDGNYTQGTVNYQNVEVLDANIADQLDRRTTAIGASFRTALTPLTTFAVKSTLQHDRFVVDPSLNNNSLSVVPGLEFTPDGRLSGTFSLGVKAMRPLSAAVPPFTGLVAKSSINFLVRDTTRLGGTFGRDLEYSIDVLTPYYISTAESFSVTQLVVGHVDSVVGVSYSTLAYRDQIAVAGSPALGRTDRTQTVTAGLGYRFRIDARLGFTIAHARRYSALDDRRYSGLQFGGTMTYGF